MLDEFYFVNTYSDQLTKYVNFFCPSLLVFMSHLDWMNVFSVILDYCYVDRHVH